MAPSTHRLLDPAVRQVRRWVLDAFPRGSSGIDYDHPPADPGLFGPGSVTWRVHADFAGMLSGGLCALMLQALHPRVLAGVYDHSNFRDDLVGRLRRTTAFVAGTTYASTPQAQALVDRVRRIHARVTGTLPDGTAYAADDPELLAWVHVTEAYGFLRGYDRYRRRVPVEVADRYYDETRRVAHALGARELPGSAAQVAAYFERMRPQLRLDDRAREVLRILAAIRLPVPLPGLSRGLFLGAGAALLPDWARPMLGRHGMHDARDRASAAAMARIAPLFRLALDDGPSAHACRRMGVSPAVLDRWP